MKSHTVRIALSVVVLACLLFSLIVSCVLMYNLGIYVDEAGTSPDIVCGGELWLSMDWIRLAVLALATVVCAVLFVRECVTENGKA